MRLSVIGTGYVGLVTGTCFAEYGNTVVCVDTDAEKVKSLNQGHIPIYEPQLEEMVRKNMALGNLTFTMDLPAALKQTDICFICVGTPQGKDGRTDLTAVLTAAKGIGQFMNHEMIIVNKSTVPAGTADLVKEFILIAQQKRGVAVRFQVASNPEFLKEGNAVEDCMHPDRVVVGVADSRTGRILHELYKPFTKRNDRFIEMDIRSAEVTKYAANAMLAMKISFMNEMANVCERVGADVSKVRIGIGSDTRIGYSFIYPGIGYGGSCFPKDVRSLIRAAEDAGWEPSILRAVDKVNDRQKTVLADKVKAHFGENLNGRIFAIWGLTFKPDTDDMREAPSIPIINALTEAGAQIRAYDPKGINAAKSKYFGDNPQVEFGSGKYDILSGADALLLLTEWKEFVSPDFGRMKSKMKAPVVFDGRNQYDDEIMAELGFTYIRIGRGA